jgi:hypothetical protein
MVSQLAQDKRSSLFCLADIDERKEFLTFATSTKIFIGDFLRPTGVSENNGDEKYVR